MLAGMLSIAGQASTLFTHGEDMQSRLPAVYVYPTPSGAKQTSFKEGIDLSTFISHSLEHFIDR